MDGKGVQGVLIDELLLFQADRIGVVSLQPDAMRLLCRLQYSKLCLGLLQREDEQNFGSAKEFLLQDIGVAEALQYVRLFEHSSPREALCSGIWVVSSTRSVYITGQYNQQIEGELIKQGWKILRVGQGSNSGLGIGDLDDYVSTAEQLYEIPAALSVLNKKAWGEGLVVVGYTMKWSRELEFLKRDALPMVRNLFGISFVPVQLDRPLERQLIAVDVFLHKATDEIVSVNHGHFRTSTSIEFSVEIQQLQR